MRLIAIYRSILITVCNNTPSGHSHLSNVNYLIRVAIFGKPSLNICWMFIWCISSLQCISKCDHSPNTCQAEIGNASYRSYDAYDNVIIYINVIIPQLDVT